MTNDFNFDVRPPDTIAEPPTQDLEFEIVGKGISPDEKIAKRAGNMEEEDEFRSIEKVETFLIDERYKVGERVITDHETLEQKVGQYNFDMKSIGGLKNKKLDPRQNQYKQL